MGINAHVERLEKESKPQRKDTVDRIVSFVRRYDAQEIHPMITWQGETFHFQGNSLECSNFAIEMILGAKTLKRDFGGISKVGDAYLDEVERRILLAKASGHDRAYELLPQYIAVLIE